MFPGWQSELIENLNILVQVFWSSGEPKSHLKEGRCLKTTKGDLPTSAESPEKAKSRSSSPPFIKWKPLRKPIEKVEVVEKQGKKGEIMLNDRVVSYRSPSPPRPLPVPPPNVKARASNLPKYMLDGRVAYYICR